MTGPDPDTLHPVEAHPRVTFLRPLAEGRANVEVGRFAYYDDPDHAEAFFERNVLYHYDFVGDRLIIGAFVAIATGAKIVMNGANHTMAGLSTYPFEIFGHGWETAFDAPSTYGPHRGDTVIGPDVWIGGEAMILPGVTIGAGAIVGARSVVGSDVPPYAVVVGNPARPVRTRFAPEVVSELLALAWWDWPVDRITRALPAIRGADIAALRALAGAGG